MGIKDERPSRERERRRGGAELAKPRIRTGPGRAVGEPARSEGLNLIGENGLLQGLVMLVLEGALEAEVADLPGYERGDKADAMLSNSPCRHAS
ncbi:hypothetical protein OG905_08825 [Streptomyces sp. NBC_00322]|nr:hypothetical protein [Streptomyces sp. NBC_00322]